MPLIDITIWGVRGALPRPGRESNVFGGNTTCISVAGEETTIILDAGSGMVDFGQSFQKDRATGRLDILLSHLHLDHVMGFFSFQPLYDPEMEIHIYGRMGFWEQLKTLVGRPYWPVGFDDFPARIYFHEISAKGSFSIGDVQVYTMAGNHPGGSILYRLESAGKRLVYALDCEMSEEIWPKLTAFSRQSDLLIWDACFTSGDLRPGWGHSTWEQGLAMRQACGAAQIFMTHYNLDYTDEFLLQQEMSMRQQDASCYFAREGMVIGL